VPKHVGRATHALSVVDHPINLILSPTDVFWTKNHYIYGPKKFSGGERHKKIESRKQRLQ
jgi:hypothetical protein